MAELTSALIIIMKVVSKAEQTEQASEFPEKFNAVKKKTNTTSSKSIAVLLLVW